jgi:Fe-S-cluster-containing hydrogenase component 2
MIVIDEDRCSGCGVCVEACPEGAIVLRDSAAAIERHLCTGCADCLPVCSQAAIYEVEAAPVPVAVDVLAGLARRWLDERSLGRKVGDWSGPGTGGRQRRRRRGHHLQRQRHSLRWPSLLRR